MEIILVAPVKKLGKIGDILKVKDGFARNYLIPRKIAVRATESNKELVTQQRNIFKERDDILKANAEHTNSVIIGKELIFIKQAGDDGRLFGSVSTKEIAKSLSQIVSHPVPYSSVVLNKQIKSTGLSVVEVRLHAELSVNVTVIVAKSESEAQDYLKNSKERNNERNNEKIEDF